MRSKYNELLEGVSGLSRKRILFDYLKSFMKSQGWQGGLSSSFKERICLVVESLHVIVTVDMRGNLASNVLQLKVHP